MPRKSARAAQVPGAPAVDTTSIPGATLSPETPEAAAASRGKVGNAEDVIEAEAAPVAAAEAAKIDPTTLKRSVLTDEGWLCPQPKFDANNRFANTR